MYKKLCRKLVTFTKEMFNGNLHLLCSEDLNQRIIRSQLQFTPQQIRQTNREDTKIVNRQLIDIPNERITFQSQYYKHWIMMFSKFNVSNKETKVELDWIVREVDVLSSFLILNTFFLIFTCSKLTIERLEKTCEISSKLTIKTPEQLRRLSLLLTLNLIQSFFKCFYF